MRPCRAFRSIVRAALVGLAVSAWLPLAAAAAGPGELPFQRLTLADGLSQETIYSITQDRQGFMWFGTLEGLNRFDGRSFEVFTHSDDDPGSLSSDWVRSVVEDAAGVLWVGTDDGLNRFDAGTRTFEAFRHDAADPASLSDSQVRVILETADGELWIGTDEGGLARFDRASRTFEAWVHDPAEPRSLPSDHVTSLFEDRQGTLWVGTEGGGLARFDRVNGDFARYANDPHNPASLSSNRVRTIFEDLEGQLWVGTYDAGLNRLNRASGKFTHYRHDPGNPSTLGADRVRGIYQDRQGRLWIGTDGGLNLWNPADETFSRYRHDPTSPRSLSDNWVTGIFQDRGGVLWVGTYGGVNRWNSEAGTFAHFKAATENRPGLSNPWVNAIFEDRDGSLWVGTSGGLDHFSPDRLSVRHFNHRRGDDSGPSDYRITALLVDGRGELWVGSLAGGLDRFNRASETFENFAHDPGNPHSLSANGVTSLAEDALGALWIGTYRGGLNRLDRTTGRFTHYRHEEGNPEGLSSDRVLTLFVDRTGALWIGTGAGLDRLDPRTGIFSHYQHDPADPESLSSNNVFSIAEDSFGTLWVGTRDGGLNAWSAADRRERRVRFKRYGKGDGLRSNFVYGVIPDSAGDLWLSSNRGLSRLDPAQDRLRHYDLSHGLQSLEFNAGAFHRAASGEMFFGGPDGLNAFFPSQLPGNSYAPPVVITRLLRFNEPVMPGVAIDELEKWELGHRDSVIAFDFAALDFTAPEKNRYRHKLEGFENEWVETGEIRRATYTNLDPGEYTFRVIAANNEGVWNEEGASVSLTVAPPPWRSWWAHAIYALATAIAVSLFWRAQARKRERAAELEQTNLSLERQIHERRRAELALRKVSSAVEQSPASVMITDLDGRIEYVNPKFSEITGYSLAEVRGSKPAILESGYASSNRHAEIWQQVREGAEWRGELHSRKKDGELYWEYASVSPIRSEDGTITHILAANEDITVRKEYEEKILYQEHFDGLTELPNRTLAFDRLSRALVQAQTRQHLVAVVCVDLDNFKVVNETLGHSTGDQLLIASARRLLDTVGESATVARLAGDEFLVVLPDLASVVEAEVAAAEIRDAFRRPFDLDGRDIFMTASLGITAGPEDGNDAHTLFRNADAAMHIAKKQGRGAYRFFTPSMNDRAQRRLSLDSNLRTALAAGNQLQLAYQPILEAGSGDLAGFEALLRWYSPELGKVMPSEFIPVAEENGLIVEMGRWVLETAIEQLSEWRRASGLPLRMAVNVSSRQFGTGDLAQTVSTLLTRNELPADCLELEITESLLLEDSATIQSTLQSLSDLGVRLSLDDFGTGYSALSYLKKYRFDSLKIDRSFVAGSACQEEDASLVHAILAMGHSLSLEVIAEGVETADQYAFLRTIGCEFVQGYYLYRPMPADDVAGLLARSRRRSSQDPFPEAMPA